MLRSTSGIERYGCANGLRLFRAPSVNQTSVNRVGVRVALLVNHVMWSGIK